jgi:hypothetical protein
MFLQCSLLGTIAPARRAKDLEISLEKYQGETRTISIPEASSFI